VGLAQLDCPKKDGKLRRMSPRCEKNANRVEPAQLDCRFHKPAVVRYNSMLYFHAKQQRPLETMGAQQRMGARRESHLGCRVFDATVRRSGTSVERNE